LNQFIGYFSEYGIFINKYLIFINDSDIFNNEFKKCIDKYIILLDDYGIFNDKSSGFINDKGVDKILNLNFRVTDVNEEKSDEDFS